MEYSQLYEGAAPGARKGVKGAKENKTAIPFVPCYFFPFFGTCGRANKTFHKKKSND
jgi:hypothetical protein